MEPHSTGPKEKEGEMKEIRNKERLIGSKRRDWQIEREYRERKINRETQRVREKVIAIKLGREREIEKERERKS